MVEALQHGRHVACESATEISQANEISGSVSV